jgi:hypothetical protein
MKHNLIKTDNYLLVVDDSEIKIGDYFIPISGIGWKINVPRIADTHGGYNSIHCKKIISHAPLNGAPYLGDVDRLPPTWRDGGEKREYKEEDIRKAFCDGQFDGMMGVTNNCPVSNVDTYIQSLQQPKYPIAFECEMELVFYPANMPKEGEERPPYRPKTIINSEGRTEWVGKYIYN